MPSPFEARSWLLPSLMSFVAAYVDTVGFVALSGLFTAHVTGNFVLIGATLAHTGNQPASGLVTKLLALPMFALVVAVTTLVIRRLELRVAPALPVVAAQALLIAGFLALAWAASPIVDADAPLAMLAGMLGVAAMAVQNTASRTVFVKLAPSTVMTGNVTQVVIDSVDLMRRGTVDSDTATRARIGKMVPPVLAFAVGAISGALAFRGAGFAALLLPLLAQLVVCAIVRREGVPA